MNASVYLFSGENEYFKKQRVDKLVNEFVEQSAYSFDKDLLYSGEIDVSTILNKLYTPPLLSKKRVVILKDIHKLNEYERRAILKYIDSPSPTTCLILTTQKIDLQKKFFKTICEKVKSEDFRKTSTHSRKMAIGNYAMGLNLKIEDGAVELLEEYLGPNLTAITNEIKKLQSYVGDKDTITESDVKAIVGESKIEDIFKLQDSVGERKSREAIESLNNLLQWGEKPLSILLRLGTFFLHLLEVKSLLQKGYTPPGILNKLHLKSYYVKKCIRFANNFSEMELQNILYHTYKTELSLKAGFSKKKTKVLLETYITDIFQRGKNGDGRFGD